MHAEYLAECLPDSQWMLIHFDVKTDEFRVSIFNDVKLFDSLRVEQVSFKKLCLLCL